MVRRVAGGRCFPGRMSTPFMKVARARNAVHFSLLAAAALTVTTLFSGLLLASKSAALKRYKLPACRKLTGLRMRCRAHTRSARTYSILQQLSARWYHSSLVNFIQTAASWSTAWLQLAADRPAAHLTALPMNSVNISRSLRASLCGLCRGELLQPCQPTAWRVAGWTCPTKLTAHNWSSWKKSYAAWTRVKNALLMAPAGSGKSSAVLCAALAWQAEQAEQHRRHKMAGAAAT